MKKLIFTIAVAALAANALHAELKLKEVTTSPISLSAAMIVDNNNIADFQPACVYETDNGIYVTVYKKGSNLEIEKQFSIPYKLYKDKDGGYDDFSERMGFLFISTFDMDGVYVSRNFFEKNGKWHIVTKYRSELDKYEFRVIDENGKIIGIIPSSSSEYLIPIYLDGISHGTPFLKYMEYDSENDKSIYHFYTFTDESGVESVAVPMSKAYPNPLPSGETFTVELETPADNATFFSVTDMKGRQVFRGRVPAGESTYKVPGLRVGHGHYIYTVVYSNGEIASGRLMAE